jgi:arsenate reductase
MIVYGIKNCNTVKKALNWLQENNIDFEFHDYKKSGINDEKIENWQKNVPWESLINKRGTTWRKLTVEQQNEAANPEASKALMKEYTSLIKRPIIETGDTIVVGFNEEEYQEKLLANKD